MADLINAASRLREISRRHFFSQSGSVVGAAALCSLLAGDAQANTQQAGGVAGIPHFLPRAKRVIYLCQSGAPSQLDLFDDKPLMRRQAGKELPDSIRRGQRLTTMTSKQESFPVAASMFRFAQHGESGAWVSELMPHIASIVDDVCFIRSMHTEAINHDPAITFMQTESRGVGQLWPGNGQSRPAGLRRVAFGDGSHWATAVQPPVGQRLPADSVSRRAVPWHG